MACRAPSVLEGLPRVLWNVSAISVHHQLLVVDLRLRLVRKTKHHYICEWVSRSRKWLRSFNYRFKTGIDRPQMNRHKPWGTLSAGVTLGSPGAMSWSGSKKRSLS